MNYKQDYAKYADIETGYQSVKWNEPIIYDLGHEGIINQITPPPDCEIKEKVGDIEKKIPAGMRRRQRANLPEISEPEIMRHYIRLSQNVFGYDVGSSMGLGTCTMKYSPKINDQLASLPEVYNLHPLQDESTIQGALQITYELRNWLCEIAGMDEFTFQPRGGAHGIFTNAAMIKAYHHAKGEDYRDEIITTAVSHPVNAGSPASIGYKIITLYPDAKTGNIGIEQMRAAISKKTAALMITAPYDTGVFDSYLKDYIDMVHSVGGLVAIDQANFNGVIGRLRAGDIGADMMHFNLHKTFSSPHGCYGPGSGAVGVKNHIVPFLPKPLVTFDGSRYHFDYSSEQSIGKVGTFFGNIGVIIRAYAWIKALGAKGLIEASGMAVINNNYLIKRMLAIRGVGMSWPNRKKLQEARFTVDELFKETGVSTFDICKRIVDFGILSYFTSHEPMVVSNPITPEPSDSVTIEELDRFAEIIEQITMEAHRDPMIVKTAPHRTAVHQLKQEQLDEEQYLAATWRMYLKKHPEYQKRKGI